MKRVGVHILGKLRNDAAVGSEVACSASTRCIVMSLCHIGRVGRSKGRLPVVFRKTVYGTYG